MKKSMIINFKMISYGNFARKRKQFFFSIIIIANAWGNYYEFVALTIELFFESKYHKSFQQRSKNENSVSLMIQFLTGEGGLKGHIVANQLKQVIQI